MHGLPENIDLKDFIVRQISQICFGAWVVKLDFDGPVQIVVESSIVLTTADGKRISIEDFHANASLLCALIGTTVLGANRTADGGLVLSLSSDCSVEIKAEISPYESFQLHIRDETIVA
jgi:hypothetical protein